MDTLSDLVFKNFAHEKTREPLVVHLRVSFIGRGKIASGARHVRTISSGMVPIFSEEAVPDDDAE